MKNQVDPRRFIGKSFTRRRTFATSEHDYGIWIDGLLIGRIMQVPRAGHKVAWYWSLNGPYYPGPFSPDGEADSFEVARRAFKAKFWQWHVWAMKQEHMASWEGANA